MDRSNDRFQDSLACGLFFATFEWMKQQGYYYFLDEIYGVQVDSENTLNEIEKGWNEVHKMSDEDQHQIVCASGKKAERPPLMLEPLFVILAGATAAVVSTLGKRSENQVGLFMYGMTGLSNN